MGMADGRSGQLLVLCALHVRGTITVGEAADLVGVDVETAAAVLRRAVSVRWATTRTAGGRLRFAVTQEGRGSLAAYLALVAQSDVGGHRQDAAVERRDSVEVRGEIVERYRGGATVQELTERYGDYAFVRGVLRESGTPIRRPAVHRVRSIKRS